MLKIPMTPLVLCLFLAIFTLFSCSKSPPYPDTTQSHQEQINTLQNQLESAQQEAKESQQATKETLSELHKTQIRSTWITGLCVSAAVVCLFTGINIGLKTKQDAIQSKSTKKGGNANDNQSNNKTSEETKSEI